VPPTIDINHFSVLFSASTARSAGVAPFSDDGFPYGEPNRNRNQYIYDALP